MNKKLIPISVGKEEEKMMKKVHKNYAFVIQFPNKYSYDMSAVNLFAFKMKLNAPKMKLKRNKKKKGKKQTEPHKMHK